MISGGTIAGADAAAADAAAAAGWGLALPSNMPATDAVSGVPERGGNETCCTHTL